MQPMVRLVPRLANGLVVCSTTFSRASRSSRPSIQALACIPYSSRFQNRCFADDSKPPTSPEIPRKEELASREAQDGQTEELPSSEESRRLALTKRFSHLMDNLQGNFIFPASQRINDLTGYSGIEALKARIIKLEQRVQDAQEAVRTSRQVYKTTVADRASTQREVTTLLARKDSWTPIDLERFTSLYRSDHTNEQAVQESATKLADAEREAEHAATTLSSSILARYHEEQIWSDKIRRMSTWGTWGLMGVNVLLFLVFQLGFEPWRRRRLVRGFEEKVREALELERVSQASSASIAGDTSLETVVATGLTELEAEVDSESKTPDPAVDTIAACIEGDVVEELIEEAVQETPDTTSLPAWLMKLRRPETWRPEAWKSAAQDLFSERLVSMRQQDITIIALEGAAAGAAIAGIIATALLRHS
ncbi:Sensitive to high expression protein 9-like protein, mitochondrial [Phlyctema vagabunda]|uniref:Sensitive to high expression protein 9, mitochondrial n=1 Tax=Phlyctema vagabunda TaxID=108571 RepID=A0ABR4PVI4_9HELO